MNKRMFTAQLKTRAEPNNDEMIVEGYFSVFDEVTKLYDGVYEKVRKGAFSKTLNNDIRALLDHDSGKVVGRNKSGTLELREDDKGLYGKIVLPNTSYAKDIYELIKRGDVNQCSFGFNILKENDSKYEDGYLFELEEIDLHEVSIVTFPAYPSTSISARSKDVEKIKKRELEVKVKKLKERFKKC